MRTPQISEILARKGSWVATISADAPVGRAIADLARRSIGALVVSADARRVEGIISERDIVRATAEARMPLDQLISQPVRALMSMPVLTCTPDDTIDHVMAVMTNERVRHLPVCQDGQLCGLVSIGDIVKSRIGQLEEDHRVLVDYISAR